MDTEQTVEQKRAIWQRVNPTLQPYPAEADAVNVCCMGVNAREDVEVIQGFIEEELADRRSYLACAGMAPNAAARQVMRRLAAEEGGHARKLMGVEPSDARGQAHQFEKFRHAPRGLGVGGLGRVDAVHVPHKRTHPVHGA